MTRVRQVVLDHRIDPPVQVGQGELSLSSDTYSVTEGETGFFTIQRGGYLLDRISVDWAITNANVTPTSGTETFDVGETLKLVAVQAGSVGPTEVGELTLSNPQTITGTQTPALVDPHTASFTINNLGTLTVDVYPDFFHSIGMVIDLPSDWDTNHLASVSVRYRRVGAGPWNDALDLIRNDYQWFSSPTNYPPVQPKTNNFAGSLFFLTPGIAYEVELTYTDPERPTEVIMFQATTRALPVKPTGGNTYYCEAGSVGGNGSSGSPFGTLEEVDAVVSPGDRVKLRDTGGVYPVSTLTTSGAVDNYIVYEPDTGHSPVIDQINLDLNIAHLWFGPRISFVWQDKDTANLNSFVDADVNPTTNRITVTGHGYSTGKEVYVDTDGTLPDGLLPRMYAVVQVIDENTIELYQDTARTTIWDIVAANGSGTHRIGTFYKAQNSNNTNAFQVTTATIFDSFVAEDIIIEGNTFDSYFDTILANRPVKGWVVMDNDLVGWKVPELGIYPSGTGFPPGPSGSGGKGVFIGGEGSWDRTNDPFRPAYGPGINTIIGYNSIQRFSDAAGFFENTDFFSNRVFDNAGNAQADSAYENVRYWGNISQRNWNGAVSLQPQRAGPHYFIYNQLMNTARNSGTTETTGSRIIKFQESDRCVMINNNHIGPVSDAQQYAVFYSRNNVFVRGLDDPPGGTCWATSNSSPPSGTPGLFTHDWQSDLDYDVFITAGGSNIIRWQGTNYSTIAAWSAVFGGDAEANGIKAIHAEFDNFHLDPFYPLPLAAGSNPLVGTGDVIPNIGDWIGATVDRGAYQRGVPVWQIGPRTSELNLELSQRTDYWSKY